MGIYIIADNQELTALALESLLKRDESNVVLRATRKAQLAQLLNTHEHAIVLLDYTLFDFTDIDNLLIMSERFAMTSWLLISDDLTESLLRRIVFSSHAFSVVFKDLSVQEILHAINEIARGRRFICQRVTEMLIISQRNEEKTALLTATEIAIVKAIAQGKTTKEIAAERFLSAHTVNTHRKNIFRKLSVNTAHEAVKYALRAGWVDPSDFYI